MMTSNRFSQFLPNNKTGTFGTRSSGEQHDPRSRIRESRFEHADGHVDGETCTPHRSSIGRDRPRIPRQLLNDLSKLEFGLLNGHKESRGRSLEATLDWSNSTWSGRAWTGSTSRSGSAGGRRGKTKHFDNLLGRVILASSEHVRLGAIRVPDFMHLCHSTERDETNQSVGRQQAQADDDGFLERIEIFLVQTGIDHKEENRRDLSRSREGVLDRRVLWKKLGREVGRRNVLVMRREGVSLQTKGTDPDLASSVDGARNRFQKLA